MLLDATFYIKRCQSCTFKLEPCKLRLNTNDPEVPNLYPTGTWIVFESIILYTLSHSNRNIFTCSHSERPQLEV